MERYSLVCIAEDGESKTEHNIFSEDNCFDSIGEAWERNEDMGSRWIFYPIRCVVNQDGIIVSADDEHTFWEGMTIQDVCNEMCNA